MAVNTIQELIQYVKTLPLSVQSKVYAQYNLDKIDVFTAGMLLKKLQYENHTNPINNSINEYLLNLDNKKEKSILRWELSGVSLKKAQDLYAKEKTPENEQLVTDAELERKLAGEHMVDAVKRANNSHIQYDYMA